MIECIIFELVVESKGNIEKLINLIKEIKGEK